MARWAQVTVADYQSLSNISVPVGSFTVVTGQTNSGKSAFTRAVRTLVRNTRTPLPAQTATIELTLDDGDTYGVRRGKGVSEYHRRGTSGEAKWVKAGVSVPEQVEQALSTLPVTDAGDPVFTTQLDPPYLLLGPRSVPAQLLAQISGAEVLMQAASLLSSGATKAQRAITQAQGERDRLAEQLSTTVDKVAELEAARERLQREILEEIKRKAAEMNVSLPEAEIEEPVTPLSQAQTKAQLQAAVKRTMGAARTKMCSVCGGSGRVPA